MRLTAAIAAILCAVAVSACGSSSSPTIPSTPTVTNTEVLSGSVAPGGTTIVTFVVSANGTASLTLLALASGGGPLFAPALTTPINVAIGTLNSDSTCTPVAQAALTSQLTPQLNAALVMGNGCVQVTDLGNLTTTATFTVRVVHT